MSRPKKFVIRENERGEKFDLEHFARLAAKVLRIAEERRREPTADPDRVSRELAKELA